MSEKIAYIILILLLIAGITIDYQNKKILEIEVKDKYVKLEKDDDVYMVVDTNNNSYQIKDLFLKLKFNSTDIYNKIEKGKKYKIEITGYRNRFLSWYPIINKVEESDK